jgi:NAD(P)-dependent dehydrogenase (short-subunit alcohol dehydrogenase family)
MIYGATKAALRSCGRTIAKELTTRGIRVNTISPGPIITPILDKGGLTPAQKHNFIEGAKTRTPLGRTGTAVAVTLNCGCGNGNRFKQMDAYSSGWAMAAEIESLRPKYVETIIAFRRNSGWASSAR